MIKNCFSRIINWPHHANVSMSLCFVVCFLYFFNTIEGDYRLIASLINAAIITPILCVLLTIPYLITVAVLAALFSLLRAIQTRFRRPFPTIHRAPSKSN